MTVSISQSFAATKFNSTRFVVPTQGKIREQNTVGNIVKQTLVHLKYLVRTIQRREKKGMYVEIALVHII